LLKERRDDEMRQEWKERAEEIKRIAFSFKDPLLVHHYDADGIAAGAIISLAWKMEKGKAIRRMWVKNINEKVIEQLKNEKEIIFADVGNCKEIEELKDVVIIDHHQPADHGKPQFNPHLYGIDGSKELSGAGAAYCVFGIAPDIAIVGTVGDLFDPMIGLSKLIVEEGVKRREVVVKKDILLYGRYARPLIQFLAYNDDPFIPGISYNEDGAEKLLASCNIKLKEGERWRCYGELSFEEKQRIISSLVPLLPPNKAKQLVGNVFELQKRKKYKASCEAREFATMLNACGRHGKANLGVDICLNKDGAYEEGEKMLALHKAKIKEGVKYGRERISDLGAYALLDGRGKIDEGIIGIVCGMLNWLCDKPVVGIANGEEGMIKVSIRVPSSLDVNGGVVMRKAAEQCGGIGGGHSKAAGATIPTSELNKFLLYVGECIEG
jgi:RecJ-like exonuclease